jgi:hypothetical protein
MMSKGNIMLDEEMIKKVANAFQDKGLGLLVIYAWADGEDFVIRCFSTIKTREVLNILGSVSSNVSLMPFDYAQIMNGELVVQSPDEGLKEACEWATDILGRAEPIIVASVGEDVFSAYAIGDAPMIIYLAVRIMTMIRQGNPEFNIEDYKPNLN